MSGISKRVSGSWVSGDYGIMGTSTDTLTTLPADLYADGNNATVGISGNMEQNGTPTSDNPIQPSECGDLETTGEHAGQYKIPISSASTATPVYLGGVESTRRIKKLVLTGQENWTMASNKTFRLGVSALAIASKITSKCSHYQAITNRAALVDMANRCVCMNSVNGELWIRDTDYGSSTDFNTYLAQQYAAGTPVCVWYVLAEPTTGIVNEPIRKIGDYADTVSGITIPTIAGANSFDVLTTLKPSEATVNYKGWHTGAVHERDSGQWD